MAFDFGSSQSIAVAKKRIFSGVFMLLMSEQSESQVWAVSSLYESISLSVRGSI